jgi:hypothetical protein
MHTRYVKYKGLNSSYPVEIKGFLQNNLEAQQKKAAAAGGPD